MIWDGFRDCPHLLEDGELQMAVADLWVQLTKDILTTQATAEFFQALQAESRRREVCESTAVTL